MLACPEQPQTKPKRGKRTPGTWTPEQQRAILPKAAEGRRKWAERRRLAKERSAAASDNTAPDPIADVEKRLSVAARTQASPTTLNRLADTLVKLRRASVKPSGSYPTTACSPVRQAKPSTPQSAQAADPKPVAGSPDYAQYTHHSIGPAKESLNPGTVGAVSGGGGRVDGGAGSVIEHITPTGTLVPEVPKVTSYPSVEAEIAALEARLAMLKGLKEGGAETVSQVGLVQGSKPSVVGMVPSGNVGSVGVAAQEGMEKFCVNGVWVWGKRRK